MSGQVGVERGCKCRTLNGDVNPETQSSKFETKIGPKTETQGLVKHMEGTQGGFIEIYMRSIEDLAQTESYNNLKGGKGTKA